MKRDKFVLIAGHPESVVNFRRNLIGSLQDKSLDVHVLVPGGRGSTNEETIKQIESLKVTVHKVCLNRTGLNPFLDLITLVSFITTLWTIKPKYVLAYTIKPVIYGILASRIVNIKHCFALITGLGIVFNENTNAKYKVLRPMVESLYKIGLLGAEKVFLEFR